MSEIKNRYFWCDKPSPLHDRLAEIRAKRNKVVDEANELARNAGALAMVFRGRLARGVVFAEKATPDSNWIEKGACDAGRYYMPRRNTAERKKLAAKIGAIRVPQFNDALDVFDLNVMVFGTFMGRSCMQSSGIGFYDDRVFVRIPITDSKHDGDAFPKIPSWLTECKEWEYQRWFAEGRAAVEKSS